MSTQARLGEIEPAPDMGTEDSSDVDPTTRGIPVSGFPRPVHTREDIEVGFTLTLDTLSGKEWTVIRKSEVSFVVSDGSSELRFVTGGPEFQTENGRLGHELFLTGLGEYEHSEPFDSSEPLLSGDPDVETLEEHMEAHAEGSHV